MKKLVLIFALAQLASNAFAAEHTTLEKDELLTLFGDKAEQQDAHAKLDEALAAKKPESPTAGQRQAAPQPAAQPAGSWFWWMPSIWGSSAAPAPAAKAVAAATAVLEQKETK